MTCVYCGNPANCKDHVPPKAHRGKIIMAGLKDRFPFLVVPACMECNNLLWSHPIWTIHERRKFIRKRLAQRYRRLLRMPEWSHDELDELDENGRLRQYVENSITAQAVLLDRLSYSAPLR
jgi:hypothetical protein